MKGVWGIAAIVMVLLLSALMFTFGIRREKLQEDYKRLTENKELRAEIDAWREKIERALADLGRQVSSLFEDVKREAAPRAARLSEELSALSGDLDRELRAASLKVKETASGLQERLGRLSSEARASALSGFARAKEELEKIQAQLSITAISLRSAVKAGGEEFRSQKAKMEECTDALKKLRDSLKVPDAEY